MLAVVLVAATGSLSSPHS